MFLVQKIQRQSFPLVSVQRHPILLAARVLPTTTLACLTNSAPSVSFAVLTAVGLHVYRPWVEQLVIATIVIVDVVVMAASGY